MRHYLLSCRDAHTTGDRLAKLVEGTSDFGELFGLPQEEGSRFGYVIVEMNASPAAIELVAGTGLGRFVGGANPKPLSDVEVARVRRVLREGLAALPQPTITWIQHGSSDD